MGVRKRKKLGVDISNIVGISEMCTSLKTHQIEHFMYNLLHINYVPVNPLKNYLRYLINPVRFDVTGSLET